MRILIAGGGIGGLTLALMLHARGIDCLVNEAVENVRPVGVGINLLPHAIEQLALLGLSGELDRIAIRTSSLTYANHLGQEIWRENRGLAAGHSLPQYSVHRGRLQDMLWNVATQRLGPDRVRSNRRLVGYEQDKNGATGMFAAADGSVSAETGDALVGADGIHSWLRSSLHPNEPGIRWNGIMMWRGAVDWPAFADGASMVVAGDAVAKLVLYPIASGDAPDRRLTNWVVYARVASPNVPPPERESWSRRGRYEEFSPLVDRLQLPFIDVDRLIRASEASYEYPMCDRDPLPWWTKGRVTLLGDAAHPMYPVGSNGGSQATLDARCLADLLLDHPVGEALQAYEHQRLAATAGVVHSNRNGGPEGVIDLVASRAPDGFDRIEDIATPDELRAIVGGYAKLAGFAAARSV